MLSIDGDRSCSSHDAKTFSREPFMWVEHFHSGLPREWSRVKGCLRSLALPSLIAGIAASAVTFAPLSGGTRVISSDPGSQSGHLASVFGTIHSQADERTSA